MQSINNRLM